MLKTFRKNTKVIIWTVVLSFLLWGAFSVGVQFQKKGRVAGEVFGKEVTFQEFNRFYRSSQIFSFGEKPIQDPNLLKQQAWQSLIFSKEARRRKIDVRDEEVRAEIMRLLQLQKIENPDTALYRRWLDQTVHESPKEFESQVRELLRVQKLIREINMKEDVSGPQIEELARQKFLYDHKMLSAEALKFPEKEAAEAFRKKAKSEKDWLATVQKESLKPEPTGNISLTTLMQDWGIPEAIANPLFDLKKGAISEALPLRQGYGVFRVLEKQTGNGEQFTDTLKTNYVQEIQSRIRYEKFLSWSVELVQKARLKDYMPQAEEGAS